MNELDRQISHLQAQGYPLTAAHIDALRRKLSSFPSDASFLVVVKSSIFPLAKMLSVIKRDGKTAFSVLTPAELTAFTPTSDIRLPADDCYLLVDVDTGADTLNLTPNAALEIVRSKQRTPLTIEEGIAVLTQFPELLQKNHCFYLSGSRAGDKRVPAFWLSAGKPKLGWCWAGNPHTWLGTASCSTRI